MLQLKKTPNGIVIVEGSWLGWKFSLVNASKKPPHWFKGLTLWNPYLHLAYYLETAGWSHELEIEKILVDRCKDGKINFDTAKNAQLRDLKWIRRIVGWMIKANPTSDHELIAILRAVQKVIHLPSFARCKAGHQFLIPDHTELSLTAQYALSIGCDELLIISFDMCHICQGKRPMQMDWFWSQYQLDGVYDSLM